VGQLTVRNLEDKVKAQLKRRAKWNGRSMEDEVRHILRDAGNEKEPERRLGSEIASLFEGQGLSLDIPELRGPARPARFGQ
jgi:plasmid stability protein